MSKFDDLTEVHPQGFYGVYVEPFESEVLTGCATMENHKGVSTELTHSTGRSGKLYWTVPLENGTLGFVLQASSFMVWDPQEVYSLGWGRPRTTGTAITLTRFECLTLI